MTIARVWRAWASPAGGDAYVAHFRAHVVPALGAIAGFEGATLLRRRHAEEIELVAETRWSSWEAIAAFAGTDPDVAVVHDDARRVLARWDDVVEHYEVVVTSSSDRVTPS